MLARPSELFNLLRMLRPDIFNNFLDFAYRYCNPKESQYGMDYSGAANTRELHYLLEGKIMIRRLKKDVLKDLPPKIRQRIITEVDKSIIAQIMQILKKDLNNQEERKALENIIQKRNQKFAQSGQMDSNGLLTELQKDKIEFCQNSEERQLVKAYKLSGEAKINGIVKFLENLL